LALLSNERKSVLRHRTTLLYPLIAAAILALGIGATQLTRDADAAGAILYHPSADCSSVVPTVTLTWTRLAGATSQRLEISSTDDSFTPGTFKTVNLTGQQESVSLAAPARDIPNYWRIVGTTAAGDVPSETRTFVPCGAPFLLWGPLECRNFTTATVQFRWAPVANYEGEQWIEFDSNGDWSGDDFWRIGPYSPSLETTRRSDFLDGVDYQFRVVREVDGQRQVSSVGWFKPECTPVINPDAYGSDDRLVIPAIGVDAPVNIRDVGFDAVLGVPTGGYDVVRYDFKAYPSLAGVVGGDGPKLIGGHYDYHVIGPAVFWDLAKLKPGDTVKYFNGTQELDYVVDWVSELPYSESLTPYIRGSTGDTMMLITCYGEFDRQQFGGYNQRTLVHSVRATQ
jgi:sortase (surface protein transpeptidase)